MRNIRCDWYGMGDAWNVDGKCLVQDSANRRFTFFLSKNLPKYHQAPP